MTKYLVLLMLFCAGCFSPSPEPVPQPDPKPTPTAPTPTTTVSPLPPTKGQVYGFTVDAVDNVSGIVDRIKAMPVRPWVRIVFDYPQTAASYKSAVAAISQVAEVVGQPSDSTYSGKMSVDQFRTRFQSYVTTLPQINVWEICNECNGDWAGANTAAQTDAAYDVVKASGKKALFVPYWNTPDCADKHGDYIAWTQKNISQKVKVGSDYVAVSIYGEDCSGPEPTYADLDSMMSTFAAMFPNASVGVGEYGSAKAQNKDRVLRYYLQYRNSNPRYFFFGGYWYGLQDFVPKSNSLWTTFSSAMK